MIVKRRRCAPLSLPTLPVCVTAALVMVGTAAVSAQARSQSKASPPSPAPEQAAAQVDDSPAMPAGMLMVPGRTFELGADPEDLIEIGERITVSPDMRLADIPRLMSELGKRKVTLQDFYMSKTPVTNAQYAVFVEQTGHRYPFDWWRYGAQEDYAKRLPEIREAYPDASIAALQYWQNNWKDLPHRIPTATVNGKDVPMDDYPVVYVSYFDALAYAAWAGMRLPTEAEWVLMASGGEEREFVWGDDPAGLKVQRGSRNDVIQPVGHWGEATQGPYGHQDVALGVWEWTLDPFLPLPDDRKEFERARSELLRHKMFKDADNPRVQAATAYRPEWSGDKIVIKGGMYASAGSQLRIGTRGFNETIQTMSGLGFRVAKSTVPARDMVLSSLKLDYDYSFAGGSRKPNLDDMVGAERYELDKDGALILGYHALALVPMSHATEDARMNKDRLMLATIAENRPFVVGTLITSVPLKVPELGAGIYTLALRAEGMPDDLRTAIPAARKALRAAGKNGEVEAGEWVKALSKYGITNEEAMSGDVDFIRLSPGGLKVTTKERLWLVRNAAGDYVASFPAAKSIDSKPGYSNGDALMTIAPARGKDGGEVVSFSFGVPVDDKARGRVYTVELDVELGAEFAGGDRWRMPESKDAKKKGGKKAK